MQFRLPIDAALGVAARVDAPRRPGAAYVFAHGAGAGMDHAFMQALTEALVDADVAVLRFQFPFMDEGRKRVDSPEVAQAAVRAAVASAASHFPHAPLFAGGKSFGGRMAAQAEAAEPLDGVAGLVFVGFPLHPAGKPATTRAAMLPSIAKPMLFLQGTRDALADRALLAKVLRPLEPRATLWEVEDADHGFHVPKRSGRTDAEVITALAAKASDWMKVHGGR